MVKKRKLTTILLLICMLAGSACGKNEGRSDEKSEPEPSLTIDLSEEDADKHDLAISPDKSDDPNVRISDAIEKEEFEAFVFSNDDDRQYLSPDSEDYRILYYELPAVTVFPEWTVKQSLAGDLYFAGNSHGEDNRTCTAWVIDVMSFDESGHMISEKQKLWVEKENDAVSLACSEKVCVYFFEHETGSNSIPEDFDPEATAKYCMDTILSRDVGEWYSDLEYVKRIGNSFYAQTNADGYEVSLLADHVAFADVPVRPDILAADRVDSEGFVRESINYSYQRDYFTDTQHIIYMDYAEAECIVFYSMPDKHKKNLVKGNREHFDGSYPQAAIDDGFVPEEKDAEYLAPSTDDYFLYYTVNSEHEHNERAVLLSFDEKGDPVDLLLRNYKYTINPEVVSAHYQDQGGKILYEDENLYYVQMPVDPNAYLALGVFDEYAKDTKIKHMSDFSQQGGIYVPCNAFMPDAHAYMNDPGFMCKNVRQS